MEGDDPERAGRDAGERVAAAAPARPAAGRLVPPGAHRVQPGDDERVRAVDGLGRLPEPLELCHGRVNRFGNVYGMSWFPGIVTSGRSRLRRNAAARSC